MKKVLMVILFLSIVSVSTNSGAQNSRKSDIRGTVIYSSKLPATSVWVILLKDGKQEGKFLTGDDGKYYIGNLVTGAYNLQVKKGDKVLFQKQVALPKDKVCNIQLPQ